MFAIYYLESWEEAKAIADARELRIVAYANPESGPCADDMSNEIVDEKDEVVGLWDGANGEGFIAESSLAFLKYTMGEVKGR